MHSAGAQNAQKNAADHPISIKKIMPGDQTRSEAWPPRSAASRAHIVKCISKYSFVCCFVFAKTMNCIFNFCGRLSLWLLALRQRTAVVAIDGADKIPSIPFNWGQQFTVSRCTVQRSVCTLSIEQKSLLWRWAIVQIKWHTREPRFFLSVDWCAQRE